MERRVKMNLYLVTVRGLAWNGVGMDYQHSYVVAEDPTTAYQKVRVYLDERDLGFPREREMDSVKLLANSKESSVGTLLFL